MTKKRSSEILGDRGTFFGNAEIFSGTPKKFRPKFWPPVPEVLDPLMIVYVTVNVYNHGIYIFPYFFI